MSAVPAPSEQLRAALLSGRDALRRSYLRDASPQRLLRAHSRLIDKTLQSLWRELRPAADAALVATGGYGRGELFPASDIDVLVLLGEEPGPEVRVRLERLVGTFWDIGLEVGHSVRTVPDCVAAATADITVQTALLEARFLAGSRPLFCELCRVVGEGVDSQAFLKGKGLEQEQRHAKHQDTAYALEPNLK